MSNVKDTDEQSRARFWTKVRKSDGCWEWTGSGNGIQGYGQVRIAGKCIQAHRRSWEMEFGPIPDGLFVLHRCDNRPCVRPSHLFLGTLSDNMHDCSRKGRLAPPRSLTADNVATIRRMYDDGVGQYPLAALFRVPQSTISGIVRGNLYRLLR